MVTVCRIHLVVLVYHGWRLPVRNSPVVTRGKLRTCRLCVTVEALKNITHQHQGERSIQKPNVFIVPRTDTYKACISGVELYTKSREQYSDCTMQTQARSARDYHVIAVRGIVDVEEVEVVHSRLY